MFDNIGGKIKGLARFFFIVGVVISIVIGIAIGSINEFGFLGFIAAIGGSIISWISCFVLYGFGELVESAADIRGLAYRSNGNANAKVELPSTWKCAKCGQENANISAQCKGCGQYKS